MFTSLPKQSAGGKVMSTQSAPIQLLKIPDEYTSPEYSSLSTLFISRTVQTRNFISGGAQVHNHLSAMVVDVIKKKCTRNNPSGHRTKDYLVPHFHRPIVLQFFLCK
jgi:hypothetical protein